MSLTGFFSRRRPHVQPRIEAVVAAVKSYLAEKTDINEFFPAVVAAALGDSELAVVAAFGELDDQAIVEPIYLTYCVLHSLPLEEFSTLSAVEDPEYCSSGDHEASEDVGTLRVELAFRVNRALLQASLKEAA